MDVDKVNQVGIQSIVQHMPLWLDNLRENFAEIKNGRDVLDTTIGRSLVIGAGPRLERNQHLELLADRGFDGTIIACDRILIPCLERGIIPNYVCFLDGDQGLLPFIDSQLVDDHIAEMTAVMSVTTHPAVVERWTGEILWFVNSIPNAMVANVSHIMYGLTKKTGLATAGHVTSACWSFAFRVGCRDMYLIGVDLRGIDNGSEDIEEVYQTCSAGQIAGALERGCRIVNCTEGGALTGMECGRLADVLR